jgi:archaellum component FlaC
MSTSQGATPTQPIWTTYTTEGQIQYLCSNIDTISNAIGVLQSNVVNIDMNATTRHNDVQQQMTNEIHTTNTKVDSLAANLNTLSAILAQIQQTLNALTGHQAAPAPQVPPPAQMAQPQPTSV